MPRRSRIKLTEFQITKLPAPDPSRNQVLHWDRDLKGFGVLCSGVTNSKTYIAQRTLPDGRTRRVTIGAVNEISLKKAKNRAAGILDALRRGDDPKEKIETKFREGKLGLKRVIYGLTSDQAKACGFLDTREHFSLMFYFMLNNQCRAIKIGNYKDNFTKEEIDERVDKVCQWLSDGIDVDEIRKRLFPLPEFISNNDSRKYSFSSIVKNIKKESTKFTKREKEHILLQAMINLGLISQEDLK